MNGFSFVPAFSNCPAKHQVQDVPPPPFGKMPGPLIELAALSPLPLFWLNRYTTDKLLALAGRTNDKVARNSNSKELMRRDMVFDPFLLGPNFTFHAY